ncbi:right-handed parallel beta-helix repeat-containing protein [Hydrogenophaga sp.]|uniref:right-handed parallel beta-helix repeat-containing protein n=1 Tax=Hydrogenophaga sp. TaxID=1904254 RepID=UPI0027315791|nr:right-handed parallel beta-helix repeat-containing protein [Hydrogenophaga sp.]MDP2074171.1 hypothetical protein [Hydrogenophaga sp.]MDP3109875.1 hypothetical protein [Hydrogenophaga sp.]
MNSPLPWTCLLLTTLALSACGGGGSDDTAAPRSAPASQTTLPAVPQGALACDTATGRVLNVGPGQALATPGAAAAMAQAGDVIRIAAGDYRGDVATWRQNNLTLCGVGGRARLFADGNSAGGKAIWVVSGSNITIDNVEFRNAAVPDRNGAGIRAEHSGWLRIRNSGFFDNENGILTSAGAMSLVIEGSEFARNGRGDGYTHNLYVGQIDRLTVSASHFHEAKVGHNLKSRARESVIENSYLMDGPGGTASYLADFPNGGRVVMRGNLLHKGPNAQNPSAVSFGAEGLAHATNTLELTHNTVAITRSGGAFVAVYAGTQSVNLKANLFAGTGNQAVLNGSFASGNAVQTGNVSGLAGNIPGVDNIANPRFWPDVSLQAMLDVGSVLDAGYVRDAPRPYQLRAISGARKAGALQSAP